MWTQCRLCVQNSAAGGILVAGEFFPQNLIPNVIGMKAKDAVYILENLGLKVLIKGIGTVKSQSVKPGEKILNHKVVVLTLSNI